LRPLGRLWLRRDQREAGTLESRCAMRGSFDWREEFSPEELAKARQQAAEDEQEKRRTNGQGGPWRELELIRFADLKPRLDGWPLVKGLLSCA
jgi:hypothetical protein